MKAIVSGEAAIAAILGRDIELRPLWAEPIAGWNAHKLNRALIGCSDVRLVEVKDSSEADSLAESAWALDRALRFFLFLHESEASDEELQDYAECCEELLELKGVRLGIEKRMLSNTLPLDVNFNRVEAVISEYRQTKELFQYVSSLQTTIYHVAHAYGSVHVKSFGGEYEKRVCYERLIDDGAIRDIVIVLHGNKDINFLRLNIIANHRDFGKAVADFFDFLVPHQKKGPRPVLQEQEPEDDDFYNEYDASKDGNPGAIGKVRVQQAGIVERLKQHDLVSARKYADQLVEEQRRLSNNDHIAKSLCLLAQKAKQYEATELQLEWAERANDFDPSDPKTSGHLADALICMGDFVGAYQAIAQTESRGDPLFAATSRARIRRLEGHFAEAYQMYLEAAQAHATDGNVLHAWVGVAETLRDMGKYNQALEQYRTLVAQWQNDAGLRCGLASVLMEAGRYQDAIVEFNIAARGGGLVAQNGLATANKLAGNIKEALEIYDAIIERYGYNSATLCGRADVFRANDELAAALEAYKFAVSKAGHNPRTWDGLAHILEDLRNFDDAERVYIEAEQRFPGNELIAVGRARLLRREHKFAEALKAFDELSNRFPFNRWVKWGRSDVLRSMGHLDAALTSIESLLSTWPDYHPAQMLKASILISVKRLDEAANILNDRKIAIPDWSGSVLLAAICKSKGEWDSALLTLTHCLSRARLPRERRFIKAAIATLDLQRGRPEAAAHLAEGKIGEITNVIYFHALAAAGKQERAQRLYQRIVQSDADKPYMGIVIEIARRFRVIGGKPLQPAEWIAQQEDNALLAEVS